PPAQLALQLGGVVSERHPAQAAFARRARHVAQRARGHGEANRATLSEPTHIGRSQPERRAIGVETAARRVTGVVNGLGYRSTLFESVARFGEAQRGNVLARCHSGSLLEHPVQVRCAQAERLRERVEPRARPALLEQLSRAGDELALRVSLGAFWLAAFAGSVARRFCLSSGGEIDDVAPQ